ncbi:class 3 adenylate cyclase [Sphingomonas sp. UYAg733]
MAWVRDRARARIEKFIGTVPQGEILVEDFAQYLSESRLIKASAGTQDAAPENLLVRIPRNRAIMTNGVHVYANLMDFNDVLVDAGRETEASHRRAFEFLHAQYSACDELISEFELQRVDFHGPRLHAVVLTPEGQDNEPERVRRAIAFAAAFRKMVERLGVAYPEFRTRVRVGIDSGPAVAIDGGKKDEPEPLFIGSPANHAAKLAIGGDEGIFLSPRAKMASHKSPEAFELVGGLFMDGASTLRKSFETAALNEEFVAAGYESGATQRLDAAFDEARRSIDEQRSAASNAAFTFHHKEPPLKDIVFGEHPPSRAIRMPLASIFADLDGFTAYIDNAIAIGAVAEAVANLHVLRAEMAAVLRDDFDGRKVRFIGDCVHGLIAEGDRFNTNTMDTIRSAVLAAGGIRSSFELCVKMLPGIEGLGIAIGIDFGQTPVCRLGLRGAASVRSAASRATCVSESEQQRCDGTETALGPDAYKEAPAAIREVFAAGRIVPNLTFDTAELLVGTMSSPYVAKSDPEPLRAHQPEQPFRAHSRW